VDCIDLIKKRRSVREFDPKPVSRDVLERIIDAARFAPTARGVQPWEFVVITQSAMLKQIGETTDHGRFIAQSAACIAVFSQDTKYYLEDGSAATQNAMLAAAALGVGSCWVAGDKKPYAARINELLGVPPSYKLVSLIALGYPLTAKSFRIVEKRPLANLLHWEKF
jgi:nitroreductase